MRLPWQEEADGLEIVREAASKAAENLQRRYDLLFLHLETPKPVRLTAAVRWGILDSKPPTHAWKSPIPTWGMEDYLADEPVDPLAPSSLKDWVQVVNKFISGYGYLDNPTEPEPRPTSRNTRPRVRSLASASSRTSSISEGHVSPEDDIPSKKVVDYGN